MTVFLPIVLASLIALLWGVFLAQWIIHSNDVEILANDESAELKDPPRVSVVMAARDEATGIRAAVVSLLGQDYPNYELIAVDDRSTDGTGSILDELAADSSRLRVVHIDELPASWLGKNHALQTGADASTGEWLLFTDGDVVFAPDCLRRAVSWAVAHGVDHLAVGPEVIARGMWLTAFIRFFMLLFSMMFRPWRVADPRSRAFIGIGAFNMLRSDVYRSIGGHLPVALRPDDDVKLGKLVKDAGYRQAIVLGHGLLSVEWYESLGAAIRGLTKNSFAVCEYSLARVIAGTAMLIFINVYPYVGLFIGDVWARGLCAGCVFVIAALYTFGPRVVRSAPWLALFHPLSALIVIYTVWRSAVLTLCRGGVEWRGTLYPLDELRKNVV